MRAFKRKSTGQWFARLDNLQPPPPTAEHIAHVAAEYAVPAADIELVETTTDPRVSPVMPPVRARTPEETTRDALRTIGVKARAGTATPAEVQQLLGELAARLL